MKNKILRTMLEHDMLTRGMHVVIGLSGGPDSMCMFDVFCRLAGDWDLKLHPVHVNHKFRPGAAEADQKFVEEACIEAGWPCKTFIYDCNSIAKERGMTSEEAGRFVRYESFEAVAREISDEIASEGGEISDSKESEIAIAVGQNADDQAETVLFRILRGTGVDGLAGIAYLRWNENGRKIIRPLLDCNRREIEEYCAERKLNPRRDHTNEEPIYMRNQIRLELLPLLRKTFNPNITAGLNRLAASASVDSDFIWSQAEKCYEAAVLEDDENKIEFSLKDLLSFHEAIRIRLYNKALEQIGLEQNVSAAHLAGVEAVVASANPSASWDLPEGFAVERRYEHICFFKRSQCTETGQLKVSAFQSRAALKAATVPAATRTAAAAAAYATVYFDAQALKDVYGEDAAEKITLRTRMAGDFMTISIGGSLHRKKLQDIMVDGKIPKNQREKVQLAAIGSEILWILPGENRRGRISGAYKLLESQERPIIALEYLF